MRQPEDNRTMDLLDPLKRGRGRPRSLNPLSDAERARRYRANKRLKHLQSDGGDEPKCREDLQAENAALLAKVAQLQQDVAAMEGIISLFVEYRQKNQRVPSDIFRNICQSFLSLGRQQRL